MNMKVNIAVMKPVVLILLVTVVSELLSLIFYVTLAWSLNFGIRPLGFFFAVVMPLIIVPITTTFVGALVRKNYLLSIQLQATNEHLKLKNQELEIALQEIKTLKGFIPICSICRKIRNDEGYWDVLEEYIMNHTDAKLSHGVCPSCLQREYPEVHAELMNKKQKHRIS